MDIISIALVLIAIVLTVLILLQERDSGGLGGFLGAAGGSDGSFYQKRRGMERVFFISTIILVIVFAGLSIINLF